jgi:hypothetical protein
MKSTALLTSGPPRLFSMNLHDAVRTPLLIGCAAILLAPLNGTAQKPGSSPAEGSAAPPAPDVRSHHANGNVRWLEILLPKSLRNNPTIEVTVLTEVTEAGKRLPLSTPENPAYYEAVPAGYHQFGGPLREETLPPGDMERLLIRSLATRGYLPAHAPEEPPSLLIVYSWGSHLDLDGDPNASPDEIRRHLLQRAALVGGEKFASELSLVLDQEQEWQIAASTLGLPTDLGPLGLFRRRSIRNESLLEQVRGELYYVVASAYDYQLAATDERRLLWRTRLTVASQGVAQRETLPVLVLSGGPYFGRDMSDADILSKRVMRGATVEVGPATVVEPVPPKPTGPDG